MREVFVKVVAHPLVVAVALGLLGPMALAEESETRGRGVSAPTHTVSQDELARVEQAWLEVRDLVSEDDESP